MPDTIGDAHLEQLVEVLQKERDRLEQLRYRFVALELLIDAREVRFWGWALQDLNRARLRVREADLMRAATVGTLDIPDSRNGIASLREVAAAARVPWAGILRDHHDSLSTLVTEIEIHAHRIAEGGRACLAELARTGTLSPPGSPAEARRVLVGQVEGADSAAPPRPAPNPAARLRAPGQADDLDPVSIECLLSDVITGGGRLRIPALLAFLR
ncbi:hypothetical protein HC251_00065 [Iamia sp. SCSIO 61187]|uniref:hypothetical protein n=1 Tax=Iamia sp. SCSIO 61187 TaxID=2722752 RepID=UPI001C6293F8|nr:hypothetical protein [Iamia sp. SCSIO 61187]QYG90983.1 hypothetical protein HC251_00065 [Iamia sp. SCSIO 61187]